MLTWVTGREQAEGAATLKGLIDMVIAGAKVTDPRPREMAKKAPNRSQIGSGGDGESRAVFHLPRDPIGAQLWIDKPGAFAF